MEKLIAESESRPDVDFAYTPKQVATECGSGIHRTLDGLLKIAWLDYSRNHCCPVFRSSMMYYALIGNEGTWCRTVLKSRPEGTWRCSRKFHLHQSPAKLYSRKKGVLPTLPSHLN